MLFAMQTSIVTQTVRPISDLIWQARQGVLRRRVDEVAKAVGLTDNEMARILNMSVRSLHGKPASESLTLAAGERLLLFENLIRHGLSVFDGRADLLNRWLHTPLTELGTNEQPHEDQPPVMVRQLGSFKKPGEDLASELTNPITTQDSTPQSPLAVLDTVSGFTLADDVLGRIEWGLIS